MLRGCCLQEQALLLVGLPWPRQLPQQSVCITAELTALMVCMPTAAAGQSCCLLAKVAAAACCVLLCGVCGEKTKQF
jgi:hypothetical protein